MIQVKHKQIGMPATSPLIPVPVHQLLLVALQFGSLLNDPNIELLLLLL